MKKKHIIIMIIMINMIIPIIIITIMIKNSDRKFAKNCFLHENFYSNLSEFSVLFFTFFLKVDF